MAQAKRIIVRAGNLIITREANRSIEVDTGNTQISIPQQPIFREGDNNYSVNDPEFNSSNSTQIIQNYHCEMRTVQSTQQSNINGARRTVTQTNISTNICQ